MSDEHLLEGPLGRKYYYPKKHKVRGSGSGSGGIAGMLFSALAGRRSHGHHYRPRSSFKSSLVNAVVKAVVKKIFR